MLLIPAILLLYTVRSKCQVPVEIYRNWSELVSNTTLNLTDLNRFLSNQTTLNYNVVVIKNAKIPVVPPGLLTGLKFDEFRLPDDAISEFSEGIFHRSGVRRVFFTGNELSRINRGVFTNASFDVASLAGNKIREIEEGAFGNFTAYCLILTDNQLMEIGGKTFEKSTINVLKLDRNRVMVIEAGAFAGIARLKSIDLSDNQLKSIDKSFDNLLNLSELNLTFNRITNVNPGTFSGSPISWIYLTGNQIEKIQRGVFNNPKYTFISLDNNRITDIEEASFSNTTSLKHLVLSKNKLGNLNSTSLGGFRRATSLKLNNNDIMEVFSGAFALVELAELDLSGNFLRRIDRGDFAGCRVASLKLGWNEIEEIEAGALGEVQGLAYVDLDGNRLSEVKADAICLPLANVSMANNRIRRIDKSLLANGGVYDYRLENNPIWNGIVDDDDDDDDDDDGDDED